MNARWNMQEARHIRKPTLRLWTQRPSSQTQKVSEAVKIPPRFNVDQRYVDLLYRFHLAIAA